MNPKLSPPSAAASKLRLMCSYGGYIVPRPHDKSLFYAGGETRIVALDRRITTASLSALTAHISRAIFHNRPFHLKYQLPNESLDSLISVVTDEDLLNMLEEHDRITPPSRIRLFLFPVKPESLDSTLLDPKSESWFCDALKSTRILPKGQSADSGLLMGFGSELETPVECGGSSVEDRHGAESLALETSLSFKSTGSSNSMSHSMQIGIVQCEDNETNMLQRKIRVSSSASIESDNSVGSAAPPSKTGTFQESLIQIPTEAPSFHIESESTFSDLSYLPTSKPVKEVGYPMSQQPDGKQLQLESQYIQDVHYIPQYVTNPMPISPYYPVYQIPAHQQHAPYRMNQPYPIYLVPVRSNQYLHTSMQCNFMDTNTPSSLHRPPLHPQTAAVASPVTHKEIFGAQPVAELATKSYNKVIDDTPLVSVPSSSDQLVVMPNEAQIPSEPVPSSSVAPSVPSGDFDEDIEYNPIYKTQPPPPVLPSQYQTMKMGTTLLLSESSVHRQM